MTTVTRQELQQYFYLNREINFMSNEVDELKKRYKKTKPSNTPELEMLELQKLTLSGKIKSCQALKNKIETFVNEIDDSLTRQIFYYRYIKFMTWRKVSAMVGGYLGENGARMIAERYLKKL